MPRPRFTVEPVKHASDGMLSTALSQLSSCPLQVSALGPVTPLQVPQAPLLQACDPARQMPTPAMPAPL
jgi:hypothetical protein